MIWHIPFCHVAPDQGSIMASPLHIRCCCLNSLPFTWLLYANQKLLTSLDFCECQHSCLSQHTSMNPEIFFSRGFMYGQFSCFLYSIYFHCFLAHWLSVIIVSITMVFRCFWKGNMRKRYFNYEIAELWWTWLPSNSIVLRNFIVRLPCSWWTGQHGLGSYPKKWTCFWEKIKSACSLLEN